MAESLCVGIDVSKVQLDCATVPAQPGWRTANTDAGHRTLVKQVQALRPTLIIVEATGGWAKTDAIDAQVLAHFGAAVRPTLRPHRDAETEALRAVVARRRQVRDRLTAETKRLALATPTI